MQLFKEKRNRKAFSAEKKRRRNQNNLFFGFKQFLICFCKTFFKSKPQKIMFNCVTVTFNNNSFSVCCMAPVFKKLKPQRIIKKERQWKAGRKQELSKGKLQLLIAEVQGFDPDYVLSTIKSFESALFLHKTNKAILRPEQLQAGLNSIKRIKSFFAKLEVIGKELGDQEMLEQAELNLTKINKLIREAAKMLGKTKSRQK
jgi:hypothetical protein